MSRGSATSREAVNAAPGRDPGATAQAPVLATRSDGRFLLAWQQAERIYTAVLPATPGG